jgi:hypothetical protein
MKKMTLRLFADGLRAAMYVFLITFISNLFTTTKASGQEVHKRARSENFGNTFNIGLGIAYFVDYPTPYITANYELTVGRNFTLAPFIGFASYRSETGYFYGHDYYYYHETVVPVGVKGTYYFDELLGAGPRWDFYLAASLGFVYDKVVWDNGYFGNTGVARGTSPLFLDGHLGAEYHMSRKVGLFLDLSTGVSTVGLAFH